MSRAVLQAMQGRFMPALAGGNKQRLCCPRSCSSQCSINPWSSRVRTQLLLLLIHAATGWRLWRQGRRTGRPPKARPLDGGGSRGLHRAAAVRAYRPLPPPLPPLRLALRGGRDCSMQTGASCCVCKCPEWGRLHMAGSIGGARTSQGRRACSSSTLHATAGATPAATNTG